MAITFPCECGNTVEVDESFAGKDVQCPRCYTVTPVPAGRGVPVAPRVDGGRWQSGGHTARSSRPESTEQPARSLEGNVFNGGVLGGLAAMGVAVVWFVGGLMADIIFFYPPILFIIGLVGFVKGLASTEE